MPIEYWIIGLVICFFVLNTLRRQLFPWLLFSISAWCCVGIYSKYLMPSVLGITHVSNLFILQFYIFLGSAVFFLSNVMRLPDHINEKEYTTLTWQSPSAGGWLTTFAVSNLIMHCALITLISLVWLQYPTGHTVILAPKLFQLYALDPIYWFAIQLFIMGLLAIHRLMLHQPTYIFSLQQLYSIFLLTLILFITYIFDIYIYFIS